MNGTVIPNTPIAVDFWKLRECPQAKLFFLTHLHGDHIAGLTPSWNYPIYCSEFTAELLSYHHQIKDQLIHPLTLDTQHIIFLDTEHREQMTVTLVDASHCPGAVMFLFEGYFGRILHTGDFRFHLPMIEEPPLKEYEGKIDILYLDNTYCSPACRFPSRDEATAMMIDIIQAHPEHDVVIGLRSLGKEALLCKIAKAVNEWISVPSKFYETLQLLSAPDVFQNNDSACRIRVEPFHKISNKFVDSLNEKVKTIAILPTAIYCGIDAIPFHNNDKVFIVPYSDHSSYTELMQFVSFLKPCKILPVVSGSTRGPFGVSVADRADMSRFDKYLSVKSTTTGNQAPDTVMKFMKGRASVMLQNFNHGIKRKAKKQQRNGPCKQMKKGVEYEDSPEKCTQQKSSFSSTDSRLKECHSENKFESENSLSKKSVGINESQNESNMRQDENEPDSNAELNCKEVDDNDLEGEHKKPESQVFIVTGEYNLDDEQSVHSLGFEVDSDGSGSETSTDIPDSEKNEKTHSRNKEDQNNFKEQKEQQASDFVSSSPELSYVSHLDENKRISANKARLKIKKALEFISVDRKEGASQKRHTEDFSEERMRHLSPNKVSSFNAKCVVSSQSTNGSDNECISLRSSIDTSEELRTEGHESGSSMGNQDGESQSILCSPLNGKQKTRDKKVPNKTIEGKLLMINKEQLCFNKKNSSTDRVVGSGEPSEDNAMINSSLLGSDSSVILINSDSEKTVSANSQEKFKAADLLFNDTDTSCTGLEDKGNSNSPESGTLGCNLNANHCASFETLSVIKWQPNLSRLRKRKFHEMLTKFADGIQM